MRKVRFTLLTCAVFALAACDQKPKPTGGTGPTTSKLTAPEDNHDHNGTAVELGTTAIGDFSVRAARDKGEIKPGGDAPIDVWVTGGSSKAVVVRFWIGTRDAKGSVKSKAEIEDPKEPNHWHTHAEIPSPIPSDAELWVELETQTGQKLTGAFSLKN